ncbi:oxygenase MpaB family protein [Nocardia sp. NPDC051833]|uniref:oxygenase MpaB family protein n=1 Tax=Nocardia sp. NPDC051833 TaxID=3155674 RepID=UPI00341FE156
MTTARIPDTETHFLLDTEAGPADHGLFGPGSMAWKVWSHPAAFVGCIRSFQAEMLASPEGAAAVADFGTYKRDPIGRMQRTMQYFLTVVYGDTATVDKANLRLRRMHKRVEGHVPVTNTEYSGIDPLLMLGVHLMTWHSVWVSYVSLVGEQSQADEEQYFLESKAAAVALGLDDIDVDGYRAMARARGYNADALDAFDDSTPTSRAHFSAFLNAAGTSWSVTPQTREVMDVLMRPSGASGLRESVMYTLYPMLSNAAAATLPRKMRAMASIPTSAAWEARSIGIGRLVMTALAVPATRAIFEKEVSERGYQLMHEAMAQA